MEKITLIGVGNFSSLEFDSVESMNDQWSTFDDVEAEHRESCKICTDDVDCDEMDEIRDSCETQYTIYTDGKIQKKEGTSEYEIVEDTLTIRIDNDTMVFRVFKSPKIELHGMCSPCYPNQCDLDAEGTIPCYALPDDFKRE